MPGNLTKLARLLAVCLIASSIVHATPQVIRVRGSLFDSSGVPYSGSKSITVKAYNAATGGTALWTSAPLTVTVSSGRFMLSLDATSGSPSLLQRVYERTSSEKLWFEILVGSDVVAPRFRSQGTLFALAASNAELLRGYAVSTTAPTNGQALAWSTANTRWEPTTVSGSGGIGSIGITAPAEFTVSGSPITDSGTLSVAFANQAAAKALAGATSGTVAPTFRSLVVADIPAGATTMAKGGTGSAAFSTTAGSVIFSNASKLASSGAGTSGQVFTSAGATTPAWSSLVGVTAGGTGQSTQQAAFNSLVGPTGVTVGDLMHSDGTNWGRLGRGTSGQVLKAGVASLSWSNGIYVPAGAIVIWSGAIASIPSGWALCDGTNGTPDLRNRFVIGAGGTRSPAATGGAVTHTHTVTSTFTGTAVLHGHTASSTFTGSASAHTHTASATFTGTSTTLNATNGVSRYWVDNYVTGSGTAPDNTHTHTWTPAGTVSVSVGNASLTPTGSVTTTITDANATPTGTVATTLSSDGTLPPYYALAFIMKL